MSNPLLASLSATLSAAHAELGISSIPATLGSPPKAEMGHVAISSALPAARILKRSPLSIASELATILVVSPDVASAEAVAPGFVNVRFADAAIAEAVDLVASDPALGVGSAQPAERIMIDFGGPNVKPMHVGHMRSLVIGESLRRILGEVGHDVVSDIHLGDWGLPAGKILAEIIRRAGMDPADTNVRPEQFTLHVDDIAVLYPSADAACKADPLRLEEARSLTARLQSGEEGLTRIWFALVTLAKSDILDLCGRLGAHFDLVLGESDARHDVPEIVRLAGEGLGYRDGGALLIDVVEDSDGYAVPPLFVEKEDGSALYSTTDLATLLSRKRDHAVERSIYVVDERQHLHFLQVARASEKLGIFDRDRIEHVGFGTVNGADGKPYRTRDGGVMPLRALLDLARDEALAKIEAGGRLPGLEKAELARVADDIGTAALRIADLQTHRTTGYSLDLSKAVSFEGRTGPYLLYAAVRLASVIARAPFVTGRIVLGHDAERALALSCVAFSAAVARAAERRAPSDLAEWAFEHAAAVARFYASCPILKDCDEGTSASRVELCRIADRTLRRALHLLGCAVPKRM